MAVSEHFIGVNMTPGRQGRSLKYIILHTTAGSGESALATFINPTYQRSAHEIIKLNGDRILCVREGDTSWGAANWPVNCAGYNIEHEDNGNYNDAVRTDAIYAASAARVADLCRKYGIQCKLIGVSNDKLKTPLESSGILLHKQVSQTGTACPDALDYPRIIREAQAILGGATPAVVPASAASVPGVTSIPTIKVRVTVQTLNVHDSADTSDDGNFGNTPDGRVHNGNLVDVNGYVDGVQYKMNSAISNRYLHTTNGHYIAALGTDFSQQNILIPAPVAASTPVVTPEDITDYIPFEGTATVVSNDGMNVRTGPGTDYQLNPTNTSGGVLGHGETFNISGFKKTGTVQDLSAVGGSATDIWVRSKYGNWISLAGLTTNPAIQDSPAPALAPVVEAPTSQYPAFVATYTEKHDQVTAHRTVQAVDLLGEGEPRTVVPGQIIDRAADFTTVDGGEFMRTESSAGRGAWYGIPMEAAEPVQLPNTATESASMGPRGTLVDIKAPTAHSASHKLPATLEEAQEALKKYWQEAEAAPGGVEVAFAQFWGKLGAVVENFKVGRKVK